MEKVLYKLKAAFSRSRRRRKKVNKDKGEDARVADLQLWVRVFLFPSALKNPHRLPI